jgi:hypothetical protein
LKRLLIILFISLCLLPVAVFADDTEKPIEVAWNFGFNFTFGSSTATPSGGGPSSGDGLLLENDDFFLLEGDDYLLLE